MQKSNEIEKPMVLILDTSPSMAQVVKTYATLEGYKADVFSDSAQACAALACGSSLACDTAADGNRSVYDCIILGWHKGQVNLISDFMEAIGSADYRELPLIVLSEETDVELRKLARGRVKTRLLFWRNYKRIDDVLKSLVVQSSAESRIGAEGSKITLSDDKTQASPALFNDQTDATSVARVSTRVLLVDNTLSVCRELRDIMQGNGYTVAMAHSASEARACLIKSRFDLVLTDFFLTGGVGESGEELCAYLQAVSHDVRPVTVVMTSRNLGGVVQQSLATGAIACLDKTEPVATLFARLDAIAKGFSSRNERPISTVSKSAASATNLVQGLAVPSILIDTRQNILAANKPAAKLLSDGDQQALQNLNFEKTIHSAPVKRSPEEPIKALFRTLNSNSLSVAYRSTDISASEYGLADEARLLTFDPVIQKTETAARLSVGEAAGITPIISSVRTRGSAVEVVQDEVIPSIVEVDFDQALDNRKKSAVSCLLTLDIKMLASTTGDRLSLGKSPAMLAIVKDELARHYAGKHPYKYIESGKFVFLFSTDKLQQARSLARELVVRVPELIAHLSDIELLSHSSFLQLPRESEISPRTILKHCTVACLKVEMDGLDNKIFEINSQNLIKVQKPAMPAADIAIPA